MGVVRRRGFLQSTALLAGNLLLPGRQAHARTASKAKVLIVGGGFAGSSCALRLKEAHPGLQVTLVDPDRIYTCCPMSNEVLVGRRELDSLRVSRRGLARRGITYIADGVVAIDGQGRQARLAGGSLLTYDRLVLAAGIRLLWNKPAGYTEAASIRMPHAWQAGEQTSLLASQLRALADGGVVAISVPVGPMRCPPGPFERASLIADYLRVNKPRCKILIFDANNHFPRQDEFTEAWKSLYPGMVEWISVLDGGAVERVDAERMMVVAGGQEHRADVANIIPPQAPAQVAVDAGFASDHGWCPVNPLTFESTLISNAYVIGDSCIADPMPKSASAACSQAAQCAKAIVASLDGQTLPPAELNSVCYSLLSANAGLSIHGRFHATTRGIEQLPPNNSRKPDGSEEARQGKEWFKHTQGQAFGVPQRLTS
jgi:sulfide dehydrogenase [flavocytochrome c] flavoprotein chain